MKYAIAFLLCLAGCATPPETLRMKTPGHIKPGATSALTLGMSKAEVLRLFGPPARVSADAGSETIYYVEERPWWNWAQISIAITNGAVAAYGDTREFRK